MQRSQSRIPRKEGDQEDGTQTPPLSQRRPPKRPAEDNQSSSAPKKLAQDKDAAAAAAAAANKGKDDKQPQKESNGALKKDPSPAKLTDRQKIHANLKSLTHGSLFFDSDTPAMAQAQIDALAKLKVAKDRHVSDSKSSSWHLQHSIVTPLMWFGRATHSTPFGAYNYLSEARVPGCAEPQASNDWKYREDWKDKKNPPSERELQVGNPACKRKYQMSALPLPATTAYKDDVGWSDDTDSAIQVSSHWKTFRSEIDRIAVAMVKARAAENCKEAKEVVEKAEKYGQGSASAVDKMILDSVNMPWIKPTDTDKVRSEGFYAEHRVTTFTTRTDALSSYLYPSKEQAAQWSETLSKWLGSYGDWIGGKLQEPPLPSALPSTPEQVRKYALDMANAVASVVPVPSSIKGYRSKMNQLTGPPLWRNLSNHTKQQPLYDQWLVPDRTIGSLVLKLYLKVTTKHGLKLEFGVHGVLVYGDKFEMPQPVMRAQADMPQEDAFPGAEAPVALGGLIEDKSSPAPPPPPVLPPVSIPSSSASSAASSTSSSSVPVATR